MFDKEFTFPAYRKYKGVNVWFKIENEKAFIEIKQLGKKFLKSRVEAIQYPEMVLIMDMLNCHEERWEVIPKTEFDAVNQ